MKRTMNILPLRNDILFEGEDRRIDVGRDFTIDTIQQVGTGGQLLVLTQKNPEIERPRSEDLYPIGVICQIRETVFVSDHVISVTITATDIARASNISWHGQTLTCDCEDLTEVGSSAELREATSELKRALRQLSRYRPEIEGQEEDLNPTNALVLSAHLLKLDEVQRVELMQQEGRIARLRFLTELARNEYTGLDVDASAEERERTNLEKMRRESQIRNRMAALQKELDEGEYSELAELRAKLNNSGMPEAALNRALRSLAKVEQGGGSQETANARNHLELLAELPWKRTAPERDDPTEARKVLTEDHEGLDEVKDRIVEAVAVRHLLRAQGRDPGKAPVLLLVGPPGVGKTSIAQSLADAVGRPLVRVALGGVQDEAEIRGHRRTYIGAMPGRIIQAMRRTEVRNPLIVLDEIDKLGRDSRGDPTAAMLEVLDPSQNHAFRDHYLDEDYDLSQAMFIATANDESRIAGPLRDRMEVVRLAGYTPVEKESISRLHLERKAFDAVGMQGKAELGDEARSTLIRGYTREAGVRELTRLTSRIAGKAALEYTESPWEGVRQIDKDDLERMLGPVSFRGEQIAEEAQVGMSQGLYYTEAGGGLLQVEAVAIAGTGRVSMTGSLGDVMKESVQNALLHLKSSSGAHTRGKDVHVHFPDGATPKDGPSAGIAIATAAISALTGIPIHQDIAMTGELSLRGKVLPIGGVKEKLIGAAAAGAKRALIPKANEPQLAKVPAVVLEQIEVIPVSTLSEVLELALTRPITPPPPMPEEEARPIEARPLA